LPVAEPPTVGEPPLVGLPEAEITPPSNVEPGGSDDDGPTDIVLPSTDVVPPIDIAIATPAVEATDSVFDALGSENEQLESNAQTLSLRVLLAFHEDEIVTERKRRPLRALATDWVLEEAQ